MLPARVQCSNLLRLDTSTTKWDNRHEFMTTVAKGEPARVDPFAPGAGCVEIQNMGGTPMPFRADRKSVV